MRHRPTTYVQCFPTPSLRTTALKHDTFYFTSFHVCVSSRFELFRPQPLKYFTDSSSFGEHHSLSMKSVNRLPKHCNYFTFARIQSNYFPNTFLALCAAYYFFCAVSKKCAASHTHLEGTMNADYLKFFLWLLGHSRVCSNPRSPRRSVPMMLVD